MRDKENEKTPLYKNFSSGDLVDNKILSDSNNFREIKNPLLLLKRKVNIYRIVEFLTDKDPKKEKGNIFLVYGEKDGGIIEIA
jgi:hypothetical protein